MRKLKKEKKRKNIVVLILMKHIGLISLKDDILCMDETNEKN